MKKTARARLASALREPDLTIINRALLNACRNDFLAFLSWCFDYLNPGIPMLPSWYHKAVAFELGEIYRGRNTRLALNLPPRYGKSLSVSVALPAFILGHDPTKRIVVICYSMDLAIKLANDFRAIINAPFYQAMFPGMRASRAKNTEYEVATTRGGYRLATSLDGSVTGRGGQIIIVDDPLKAADAHSRRKRARVNELFEEVLTRLDDKTCGAFVVAMHRLDSDDPCGRLKKSQGWRILSLPAIATEDEWIRIGEDDYHFRRAGEPLHPERDPISVWETIQSQLRPDIWAAQYQQCPAPPEGSMIDPRWIQRYDQLPRHNGAPYFLQSWDTALGSSRRHDYSACVTLLISNHCYYLVDVLRGRFDFPTLVEHAKRLAREHKPRQVLIEDCFGIGSALATELKNAGHQIITVKPEQDKQTRMSVQALKIKDGRLFLPHEMPWSAEFEAELFAFPNGPFDDQVDALSQALAHLAQQQFPWTDTALRNHENMNLALAFSF